MFCLPLTMPLYITQEFNHLGYTLHLPSTPSSSSFSSFFTPLLHSLPSSIIFYSALYPPSLPQHPRSPSKAILWGGNEAGNPGVFPQKISGPDYNSSFVYVLEIGVTDNATWARNLAATGGRPAPRPREGVQFTQGQNELYIYGGRTVDV